MMKEWRKGKAQPGGKNLKKQKKKLPKFSQRKRKVIFSTKKCKLGF